MKAYLVYKDKKLERIHKIDILLEKCAAYDKEFLNMKKWQKF